jgi:hypothetical protein
MIVGKEQVFGVADDEGHFRSFLKVHVIQVLHPVDIFSPVHTGMRKAILMLTCCLSIMTLKS